MFHVEQSDIYLTSNNAEDVSDGKGVSNVLCSESSTSALTSHLKRICKDKNNVGSTSNYRCSVFLSNEKYYFKIFVFSVPLLSTLTC